MGMGTIGAVSSIKCLRGVFVLYFGLRVRHEGMVYVEDMPLYHSSGHGRA